MKAFNERFKIKFLVYLLVSSMTLTEILNRKISKELFKSQTGVYVPTNYGSRIIN